MGVDDDWDCVEHVWVLQQLHLTLEHTGMAYGCARCPAVRYDEGQDAARERL